jgi:3',5'-cyclic AMP phosphodiesterase CpdA
MARLTLLSDPHLSPTHGFFWANWKLACEAVNAGKPDLVIIAGDLSLNGAESDPETEFAHGALKALQAPVHALPGNHDVGDEPPGQTESQIIDATRLARWNRAYGSDRFDLPLGAWRLIGINAQLCGSGLPEEEAQWSWLRERLASADRPVALFLHKPLFVERPDEATPTATSLNLAPRTELLKLIRSSHVRLVVSGHLHAHRDVTLDGVRYIWAPALSFVGSPQPGATSMVAAMSFDFSAHAVGVELMPIAGLVAYDLLEIKRRGGVAFLRDLPPCPPAGVSLPV